MAWDLPGYGASAPLGGPLTFPALADALAAATFRVVPGVGHLLPAEAPDVVNAALVDHFGRVEQDGGHG